MTQLHRPGLHLWRSAPRYRTIDEKRIAESLALHGWPREADAGAAVSRGMAVLDRFVALRLPFRRDASRRLFDPVEVNNFIRWTGLNDLDGFWSTCVDAGRGLADSLQSAECAPPDAGRRFSVAFTRTFAPSGRDDGEAVRLRIPLPIADSRLGALTVHRVQAGTLSWKIDSGSGRIEARGWVDSGRDVTIGVDLSFTTDHRAADLTDHDLSLYLRDKEALITVTPRVRALAERLAGRAGAASEAVDRFMGFMLDHLVVGSVHYDEVPADTAPDWVLDRGWADCQLGSALLIALCRARSIPARLVGGLMLYPETATPHFWAEVWLPGTGWAPYDLLCWDLSLGGRDPEWRGRFAGTLEPRMKTQCFPRLFTGPVGVQWPPSWHILNRRNGDATETVVEAVHTGALVYRDRVSVRMIGQGPSA